MELTESNPQRQADQPVSLSGLAYYAQGNTIHHRDGSKVATCADAEVAKHIAKRLRAMPDIPQPEQAIKAAKQAIWDALYTLERLPDKQGVPRILAIQQCREALLLLGETN